jgi:hypothetical protein
VKVEHANDKAMQVSHEPIYKSLFIQARGVLKKELVRNLRSRRPMRRARTSSTEGQARGRIVGAVSISERPAQIGFRFSPTGGRGGRVRKGRARFPCGSRATRGARGGCGRARRFRRIAGGGRVGAGAEVVCGGWAGVHGK